MELINNWDKLKINKCVMEYLLLKKNISNFCVLSAVLYNTKASEIHKKLN